MECWYKKGDYIKHVGTGFVYLITEIQRDKVVLKNVVTERNIVEPIEVCNREYTLYKKGDNINHPAHYKGDGIECIDAMEAAFGSNAVRNFCICNAYKYIWRYQRKNGTEDIKKARWYLNKYIELKEKQEDGK